MTITGVKEGTRIQFRAEGLEFLGVSGFGVECRVKGLGCGLQG